MNKDEKMMKLALEEARLALSEDEVPVGAILVMDNNVIASAHNHKERDYDISSHAEINVLKEAGKTLKTNQFKNAILYVTLEPCHMCASAIQQAKIERVVFGANDHKMGALGGKDDFFLTPNLNHYPFITSSILKEECEEILKNYFINKRK